MKAIVLDSLDTPYNFRMPVNCNDDFKYAEDEYDNPSPQSEFTNIHFYQHQEFLNQQNKDLQIVESKSELMH